MTYRAIRIVLPMVLLQLGCGGAETRVSEPRASVSVAPLAAETALRDAPAIAQVDRLRAAFASKASDALSFAVYDLPPASSLSADLPSRASELGAGMTGARAQSARGVRRISSDTHELVINEDSGSEFFADLTRFHKGTGVPPSSLMSDERYFASAREYMQKALARSAAEATLYPYKIYKYMNSESFEDGKASNLEAYEIAVAFNSEVDGVPVIGSGGKISVHLTVAGDVVAHESTVRALGKQIGTVSGSQMLSPDAAKQQVAERLAKRGVNLDNYTLTREEFGYYRRGRNNKQAVLAPHYAYFYEPKAGVVSKKRVEVVAAATDPALLGMIEDDAAADDARKSEKSTGAVPMGQKPKPGA